jgi:lysophospholipase L1-like esterase
MKIVNAVDDRLGWSGTVSLLRESGSVSPLRLPLEDQDLYFPSLWLKACMPAGVRLTFRTDSRYLAGVCAFDESPREVDLAVDGSLVASHPLGGKTRFEFADLPAGEKLIELWLPQRGSFTLKYLEFAPDSNLEAWKDPRPRWVTYGSSITQCAEAASPASTWPALVARAQDWHLTCLGFGGQCHLDLLIAQLMRDLPADFLSICAGINICNQGSLSVRSFASTLIGFVRIIREKHPCTPLLLISPIFGGPREHRPNKVDWTLEDYRNAVAEAVEKLNAHGDEYVGYQDGLELMGPGQAHLMPDDLHPNPEGYRLMGQNFIKKAVPKFLRMQNLETNEL